MILFLLYAYFPKVSCIWCSFRPEVMVGTTDYAARIHTFKIEFTPYFGTTPVDGDQLVFTYLDTLLLYDNRGVITTGYTSIDSALI